MVGGWGLQAWWGPEALATCGWRRLCAAQATTTGLQTLADLRRGVWHAARPRCELAHVTAGRLAVAGWMGRGACLPRADVCVTAMRGWPGRVPGYATKPPPLLEQATCVDTCGIRAHAGGPHRHSRPTP